MIDMEAAMRQAAEVMMEVIKEKELTEFVRDFKDESGFMWSSDKRVHEIGNDPRVDRCGHSGSSFAICMRICQNQLRTDDI